MDYIWIAVAFGFGFFAKLIYLPPLIGYLIAGFILNAIGLEPDASLETLSDLGVSLLLFTIGLKLDIKSLLKTEVWAGATIHMSIIVVLTILISLGFAAVGFSYFTGLSLQSAALIGFAVSFSSTVCAVKVLEERREMRARHGQVAIGILVIQDIAAVIFVTLAAGKAPSIFSLGLLGLILLRPVFSRFLQKCGHGELLPLAGFFLALSAGELFELVGLKAHLGALVMGALLSGDKKSPELAKSLLNFKELFLIGFFLLIGFTAMPTVDMIGVALIMAVALPVKALLFFFCLTALKVRGRTAVLSSLSLANYSEFGLIVCAISVEYGLLEQEWLVIIALAVAISFVFSSVLNINAHGLTNKWAWFISRFERSNPLHEDKIEQPIGATVLVIGMGRVGTGAYDTLSEDSKQVVYGVDVDRSRGKKHCDAGRKVIIADVEDEEFWTQVNLESIRLIMLAMPDHLDILEIGRQLRRIGYTGKTASIARYNDNKKKLIEAGVDVVFDFYEEAGAGFADESLHLLD